MYNVSCSLILPFFSFNIVYNLREKEPEWRILSVFKQSVLSDCAHRSVFSLLTNVYGMMLRYRTWNRKKKKKISKKYSMEKRNLFFFFCDFCNDIFAFGSTIECYWYHWAVAMGLDPANYGSQDQLRTDSTKPAVHFPSTNDFIAHPNSPPINKEKYQIFMTRSRF